MELATTSQSEKPDPAKQTELLAESLTSKLRSLQFTDNVRNQFSVEAKLREYFANRIIALNNLAEQLLRTPHDLWKQIALTEIAGEWHRIDSDFSVLAISEESK